jgi:hypothetical protein
VVLLKAGERLSVGEAAQLPNPLKLATSLPQLLLVALAGCNADSEVGECGLHFEQFSTDAQPVLYFLLIHRRHCTFARKPIYYVLELT